MVLLGGGGAGVDGQDFEGHLFSPISSFLLLIFLSNPHATSGIALKA